MNSGAKIAFWRPKLPFGSKACK